MQQLSFMIGAEPRCQMDPFAGHPALMLLVWRHEMALRNEGGRLGPALEVQLGQDAADVVLHGLIRRPIESATTWPERSTSMAELTATMRRKRRITAVSFV